VKAEWFGISSISSLFCLSGLSPFTSMGMANFNPINEMRQAMTTNKKIVIFLTI